MRAALLSPLPQDLGDSASLPVPEEKASGLPLSHLPCLTVQNPAVQQAPSTRAAPSTSVSFPSDAYASPVSVSLGLGPTEDYKFLCDRLTHKLSCSSSPSSSPVPSQFSHGPPFVSCLSPLPGTCALALLRLRSPTALCAPLLSLLQDEACVFLYLLLETLMKSEHPGNVCSGEIE